MCEEDLVEDILTRDSMSVKVSSEGMQFLVPRIMFEKNLRRIFFFCEKIINVNESTRKVALKIHPKELIINIHSSIHSKMFSCISSIHKYTAVDRMKGSYSSSITSSAFPEGLK